jgi:hypothetical protein
MEKRDFVYHFTNIFLTDAVRETILIENWEEKDFDPRYIEYAKFFMTMKKKYESKKVKDDELISELNERKINVIENFNKTFDDHFRNEIIKRGSNEKIADKLISSENIFFDNAINANALKTFRALEETI